jgi:hypothetical protein
VTSPQRDVGGRRSVATNRTRRSVHDATDEVNAMGDKTRMDHQLEHPQDVRGTDGTRADGRPTDPERPLEHQPPADQAPTVAPEETGSRPTTEHAPGGDL